METDKANIAYGAALIALAECDEQGITFDERATITRLFTDLGFSEAAHEAAWKAPRAERELLPSLAALSDVARRRALVKDLVLLAYADGEYSEPERRFVEVVRIAFDLTPSWLERVDAWARRGIEWQQEGIDLCVRGV